MVTQQEELGGSGDKAGHTPTPWQAQKPLDVEGDHGIAIIGLRLNDDGIPMLTPTNGLVAIACQLPTEIDDGDFTRALANAAFIVRACNNHYALLEALSAYRRVMLPIAMTLAQNELCNEPSADDAVLFSFMGSGASDQVTVGEYRKADELARTAIASAQEGVSK